MKAEKERRPAEKMRSRTSVRRDQGRSQSRRIERSKSNLRQQKRREGGNEEEREAKKERRRSQSKKTRSESLLRCGRSQSRQKERETNRKYKEEEHGRSKSHWRKRERGASRDFAEGGKERSRSQWRQQDQRDSRREGALLGRSLLHGMGHGQEGKSCQNRRNRGRSQLSQQEQGENERGRGLVGRRSRSPLRGKGGRSAHGEGMLKERKGGDGRKNKSNSCNKSGDDKNIGRTKPKPVKESRRSSDVMQQWGDNTSRSRRSKQESTLAESPNGCNVEESKESAGEFNELRRKEWLVGEVKRLEKVVRERTAKRLKGEKDQSSGVEEQGSEKNKNLVAYLGEKFDKSIEGENHQVEDEPNSSHSQKGRTADLTFGVLESLKLNAPLELPKSKVQIKVDDGLILVKTLVEEKATKEDGCDSEVKTLKGDNLSKEEEVYDPEVPTNSSCNSSPEPEVSLTNSMLITKGKCFSPSPLCLKGSLF